MSALLWFAATLLAQEPSTLDALIARHTEAAQKAKTFDELTASARATLAAIQKLLETKLDAETAARARAIACDICADLEDFDGAEAHAKAFLNAWPKHAQAPYVQLNLGLARTAAGRDAAAREAFQSLLNDHPSDERAPEARLRIAQSFICEGRDREGLEAFAALRATVKGRPEEWPLALQQAVALQIAGKSGDGRVLLEEVVKACPMPKLVEVAKRVLATWLWIGKPARPVEGWDLKEAPVKLDLAAGKVTVLYFLGTAFPDFEVEAGVMRRLVRKFSPAGVSFLAVAIDKDKPKLELDLARAGVTWPVVYDGNGFKGPIASSFAIDTLPMLFLIDRKNVIRYVNPVFGDHAREIARCLQALVSEK